MKAHQRLWEAIMKTTAIACLVAASLGFGSLSYAQGYSYGDRDGRSRDLSGYTGSHDSRQAWQGGRQYQQRQDEQRHRYEPRYEAPQYSQYRPHEAYRHDGQWRERAQYHRGDYLPYQFRQRHYYVNDWRAHHLYAPPYGYQWVQADDSGDFLLVALATGLIANLLVNQ
jgi:Ni/Co efflux regulator RcnB